MGKVEKDISAGAWVSKELVEVEFELRAPVVVQFCWE